MTAIGEAIQTNNQTPLDIHVGLHYGSVIYKDGSIYGDAVNIASRMQDIANKGETILSEDAWQQLSPPRRLTLRALGQVTVKGKGQLMRIFLAVPQTLDQTLVKPPFADASGGGAMLIIAYNEKVYRIKAPAPNFVLGRHRDCDLFINHIYVSRRHATIECMRGKFFLNDHSTNGSYINEEDQPYTFFRREMLQLHGSGIISLGADPSQNNSHLIRYECNDAKG